MGQFSTGRWVSFQLALTLLFEHHLSFFMRADASTKVLLVTKDGASVESRWVFEAMGDAYSDIKSEVWPEISAKQVADLLKKRTGSQRYTEEYMLGSSHSLYRLTRTDAGVLIVTSGIPDDSRGMRIGEIQWNGHEFVFNSE